MTGIQRYASGSPYEESVGFSRAARIGRRVIFSLTGPVMPEGVPAPADTEGQARRCVEILREVLHRAGGSLEDVVRTEIHFTAQADEETIDRLHFEYFGAVRPVLKMLPVPFLTQPSWLVEVEIEAVLSDEAPAAPEESAR